MTPIVWTYLAYLVISITLTIWVARTLHRNGRIFLVDAFLGNEALADSVNHLLVVGFYLINLGYIAATIVTYENPANWPTVLATLSVKIGGVLLVSGIAQFVGLLILSRVRRSAIPHADLPPIPTQTAIA